jgi:hypothetical protein
MQLLGTHKVSFEDVRRLAIECYTLAHSGMTLLESEYEDSEGRTAAIYETLLSEKLLHLAIAIRTKFYQGTDHRRTSGFLEDTGTYVKGVSAKDEAEHAFTLKDVCDKIIHANSVYYEIDAEFDIAYLQLFGQLRVGQEQQHWMLTLFVPDLCIGILEWLDATAEA